MHQGLYKLTEKIITKTLSFWVKPDVLPLQLQGLLNPDLPVLYVLESGGLADRAALNIICQQHGLPTPSNALKYGTASESSSVDVLKRRRGVIFRRHRLVKSQRLSRLLETRVADKPGELQIVPVAVYWGRAPDKEQSAWSLFFSENWQIGSRARKLMTTLLYGRDTLLSISEPLSLDALINSVHTSNQTTDSELLQRKLSRILRVHFRQRRIASLGPDQSHRRMLVSHVLTDPGVRQAMLDTCEKENKKFARVELRAHKYAMEIAADVSYPTVRVLHRVMNRLWTELYDGVKINGINRLKSVADGRELVYVPCHRSHIDYLLLSYILYINGFSLPHIAAGINLNLPIVGGLLRRGGAFFLRRSFAGNPLYAAVFNAYLKEILQRGHALEYFVEGGRSRTGRSLPPKGGMLAMTAHAYLRNPRTPVVFIPVYFGYERLLEGRSFTSELAGGKKQKESVFALLKSLKTLREEYGNVHVNFGTPIELNHLLDKHNKDWREENTELTRPDWLKAVIDDLGNSIMQNINDAVCVTPISLLAMGLLSTRHGNLGKPELIEQMRLYHKLFTAAAVDTTAVVPPINFEHAIAHGIKLGFIETSNDPLGTLVSIRTGMAGPMTYFSNNVQHLIATPSLLACCFNGTAAQPKSVLHRLVQYALPFLQNELYLPDQQSEHALNEALDALMHCNLIKCEQGNSDDPVYRRAGAGSGEAVELMQLAESVMPALERYFLSAAVLVQNGEKGLLLSELEEQCHVCAERLAKTHGRNAQDLYDKHLHRAMINTLGESNYATIIERKNNERAKNEPAKNGPAKNEQTITATPALLTLAHDTRTLISENMRHAILHAASRIKD